MKITVTQQDINRAAKRGYDEFSCPIARAMKRAGLLNPVVDPESDDLSYSLDDEWAYDYESVPLTIPRSIRRFVKAFDNRHDSMLPRTQRAKAPTTMIRPFTFIAREQQ